jgi:hypothetical protein
VRPEVRCLASVLPDVRRMPCMPCCSPQMVSVDTIPSLLDGVCKHHHERESRDRAAGSTLLQAVGQPSGACHVSLEDAEKSAGKNK